MRKSAIIVIDRQLDSMIFIFVLPSIYVVPGVRFPSRFSGIATSAFAGQKIVGPLYGTINQLVGDMYWMGTVPT